MALEIVKPTITDRQLKWTRRQEKFWIHYLTDLDHPNRTEAARRAGFLNPAQSARMILKKAESTPAPLYRDGMLSVGADPVALGRVMGIKALSGDIGALRSAAAAWGVNTKTPDENRGGMKITGHNVQIIVAADAASPLAKMLKGEVKEEG